MFVRPQGAAAYPENENQQQRLREAAEGLRVATNAAAQNAIKKKLVNRLEVSHSSQHILIFSLLGLNQNTAFYHEPPPQQKCLRTVMFGPLANTAFCSLILC